MMSTEPMFAPRSGPGGEVGHVRRSRSSIGARIVPEPPGGPCLCDGRPARQACRAATTAGPRWIAATSPMQAAAFLEPPDLHPHRSPHDRLGGGPERVERLLLAGQRTSDQDNIVGSALHSARLPLAGLAGGTGLAAAHDALMIPQRRGAGNHVGREVRGLVRIRRHGHLHRQLLQAVRRPSWNLAGRALTVVLSSMRPSIRTRSEPAGRQEPIR
jgi:hypothetical protein